MAKDGWHEVYGEDVYVENGKVVRGVKKGENNSEVTLSAYRAGRKRGTKCMK